MRKKVTLQLGSVRSLDLKPNSRIVLTIGDDRVDISDNQDAITAAREQIAEWAGIDVGRVFVLYGPNIDLTIVDGDA